VNPLSQSGGVVGGMLTTAVTGEVISNEAKMERYVRLVQILNDNLFFVKTLSQLIDQADYDRVSKVLVAISTPTGRILPLIRQIVSAEFERNFRNPGSILRGNCVASKLMAAYSRRVGAEWIGRCVGPVVKRIVDQDEKINLEINPAFLRRTISNESAVESAMQKNGAELLKFATEVLNNITDRDNTQLMPRNVRALCGFTAEYARMYAADRLVPLVGGFIMLRLVNPALVTPETFCFLPDGQIPSRHARRNLTLVSKLMQNLSNGILFGSKEEYMCPMNSFIDSNKSLMESFLTQLATDPLAAENNTQPWADCKSPPTHPVQENQLDMANVSVLHKLIHMFQGRLLEALYTEATANKKNCADGDGDGDAYDYAVEEQFFQILDELGEPDGVRKAQARAQDLPETVNFLLPPDKSGFLSVRGRLLKKRGPKKRFWFVLSGSFLHYFANPTDTKPHRSVPLEELSVLSSSAGSQATVTTGDTESCSFTVIYMRKEHTLYCESLEEVLSWMNVIQTVQQKRWLTDSTPSASSTKHMGKMELRMQRHLTGLKQSYECKFVGFEVDNSGILVFIWTIVAFETTWTIKKRYSELVALVDELSNVFPRIILPSFSKKISDPLDRTRGRIHNLMQMATTINTKLKDRLGPTQESQEDEEEHSDGLDSGLPSTTASTDADEELRSSTVDEDDDVSPWLLTLQAGRPTLGVIYACKFLKVLMQDLLANFRISQSETIFRFLELASVHRAVKENCERQLTYLKEEQVDLNQPNRKGLSAMHLAAAMPDRVDMICRLHELGADIQIKDRAGNTPLHLALRSRHGPAATDRLLDLSCDVNVQNSALQTPLHVAADEGHLPAVRRMMAESTPNVNLVDRRGRSALQLAINSRHDQLACVLIEHKADVRIRDSKGNSPVHLAVRNALPLTTAALLAHPAVQVNASNQHQVTALHFAAHRGSASFVRLLAQHPDIDADALDAEGRTPLVVAALRGHSDVCALLLRQTTVNLPTHTGFTALHAAAEGGHADVLSVLTAVETDINRCDCQGHTPLHVAVLGGHASATRTLLRAGANPNALDHRHRSPLHLAAVRGQCDVIVSLIAGGASLDSTDAEGSTALHVCLWAENEAAAKALVDAGANVNTADEVAGLTPLHVAVQQGLVDSAAMLLEHEADSLLVEKEGRSPLIHALYTETLNMTTCSKIAHLLVNASADQITLQDQKGNTALHAAVFRQFRELCLFLVHSGADIYVTNKAGATPLSQCKSKLKLELTLEFQSRSNSS